MAIPTAEQLRGIYNEFHKNLKVIADKLPKFEPGLPPAQMLNKLGKGRQITQAECKEALRGSAKKGGTMPVNNARVIQFINDTLERFRSVSGCCTPVTRAFRDLQGRRRQPGMSTDEDLAAAEHYMFARHAVCNGVVSKQQMDSMVVGYETVKGIAQLFPALERLMRTTPNPTARASEDSMIWGLAGSLDGQRDHDRCNSTAEPPLVNTDAYRYGAGGGL